MKGKIAHIQHYNLPICQLPIGARVDIDKELGYVSCDYPSIAAATRIVKLLQKFDSGFRVVRGHCPMSNPTTREV